MVFEIGVLRTEVLHSANLILQCDSLKHVVDAGK